MAVKANQKYVIRIIYKEDYDTEGNYAGIVEDYSGTFSNVKESATITELRAFADALMDLTDYKGAPYRVEFIDTSNLYL